jgi:hypothetical protein
MAGVGECVLIPHGHAIRSSTEIHTWVWLQELGRKKKIPISLVTLHKEERDGIAALGIDAVWFMGVWERSPAGIEISLPNQVLLVDFRRAIPDFSKEAPFLLNFYQ